MALMKWDDEEERKRQEEMQGASPIKTIASIQSGAWQPAPSGADAPAVDDEEPQINGGIFDQQQAQPQAQESENYIMSDEKAQVDEQKRQRDIEIENARRAEAARQLAAQQMAAQQQAFKKGQVQTRQGTAIDVDGVKSDTGWKKYYDKAFKKEKGELDFWGRLLDGGQASKRAEVAARTKYQRELQQQPGQEDHARSIGAYNSAQAQDNSNRARALAQGSGALTPNANFGDKVRGTLNTMKNSSIYDSLLGVNDAQKKGIDDPLRFVGNLIQGIPTMPLTGMKEGYESVKGRGTDELTGLEKELTGAEQVGRGVSGALNVVTPFVGGSGKLLDSVTTKAMTKSLNKVEKGLFDTLATKMVTGSAGKAEADIFKQLTTKAIANATTAAEKSLLTKVTSQVLIPAVEQGAIGGAQAGAEYFGQGNTLVDENGKFDRDKFNEFAKQTGTATAMGVGGGIIMGGGAMGINRLRNGKAIPAGELADIETMTTLSREAEQGKARLNEVPGERVQAPENGEGLQAREQAPVGEFTPVKEPVADGVARPEEFTPIRNEVERVPTESLPSEPLPVSGRNNLIDSSANDITPVGRVDAIKNKAVEIKDRFALKDESGAVGRASDEPTITNALTGEEVPNPNYKPVADGTARVTPAKNIPESNVTPIKSEEVRALQESKAGASQAEEAVINQKLQEAESAVPKVDSVPETVKVFIKSKFRDGGGYADLPVIRKVENKTLYQGGSADGRQFWTENEKYAAQFGEVTEKTGTFYQVDNGNRMTTVYVDADAPQPTKSVTPVKANKTPRTEPVTPVKTKSNLPEAMTPVKSEKIPKVDSVPEGMKGDAPKGEKVSTPEKDLAERFMAPNEATPKDAKSLVARALGLEKDVESNLGDLLKDGGIDGKRAQKVSDIYTRMEEISTNNVKTQKAHQKDFVKGKEVNEGASRIRNAETREMGALYKQLQSEVKAIQRQTGGLGERATQVFENVSNGRLANMLASAGLVERNIAQEVGADLISAVKNPVKFTKGALDHGNQLKNAWNSSKDGWKVAPKTVSEGYQYIIGNAYETAMTPVEAAAKMRSGAFRTEMTKWVNKELLGKNLSTKEAEVLSRTASNMTESVVNMLTGVENGMVRNKDAMKALDAWKGFMKTGEKADFQALKVAIEKQDTIAQKLVKGFEFGQGSKVGRALNSAVNTFFPFVRTAYNLSETGVQRTLHPFSKSLIDDIRADQMLKGTNAMNILKNKVVDYGMIGGTMALASNSLVGYNDGDEVDKPRGIWFKVGKDNYIPVRSTPIEFPIAVAVLTTQLAKDSASGNMRDFSYYKGMITDSIPYVSQIGQYADIFGSLTSSDGDGTYGVKSLGVNTAKSTVPFSNNSVMPYVERWKGNSVNAKKNYDKDMGKWFTNSLKNSYNIDRNSLEDSRDAAGRVRTVDNQGTYVTKRINDVNTREFNDRVSSLVEYGRKNGLGKGTQDMFNTYDDGKNNNFKTIGGQIWGMTGKGGNETKLQKNEKLAGLASQQREGFFGTTGSELLTLDGQNLYSDVSMPNADGTKNSSKPISMQSIKNAIAATDLPEEQRNRMYEISQANQALYSKVESKEWTYDQYKAVKAESEKEYVSILSNSESYKKMNSLFDKLDETGFFKPDGLGSTKSGQTYLWNSLNALLGSKGKTPAADYPKDDKGFTPWGKRGGGGRRGRKGSGFGATNKPGDRGNTGVKWTPVQKRQMAATASGKYTPVNIKVKLGNAVKKDKSQNYADRSF